MKAVTKADIVKELKAVGKEALEVIIRQGLWQHGENMLNTLQKIMIV